MAQNSLINKQINKDYYPKLYAILGAMSYGRHMEIMVYP